MVKDRTRCLKLFTGESQDLFSANVLADSSLQLLAS